MTSKTFKHVGTNANESKLDICQVPSGIRLTLSAHTTISGWFDPKQGAEIALAILEAAGYRSYVGSGDDLGLAVENLEKHIAWVEAHNAEAEAQAELEAEALAFYEAFTGYTHVTALDEATPIDKWLAVARKAREMRAEK